MKALFSYKNLYICGDKMEEKTIFRAHDDNEPKKQPEFLDEKPFQEVEDDFEVEFNDIRSVLESLEATPVVPAEEFEPTEEFKLVEKSNLVEEDIPTEVDRPEKESKPAKEKKTTKTKKAKVEKTKKGFLSSFSGFGKVIFILGLLLIIGSLGVIAYSQLPSLLPDSSTPSSDNGSSSNPSGTPSTPVDNVVTEQNATVLQLTADAGDEYMDNLLFIGDSNYNRMYMLGLLDLDHVIGVDGMGVQSVPGSRAVYFVEKSDPITIPAAVKDMQPKTIIMNFGTNNLVAATADSFIENYEDAIDAMQT